MRRPVAVLRRSLELRRRAGTRPIDLRDRVWILWSGVPRDPNGVAIDKSISPNRIYVVDSVNNRVLAWKDVTALTTVRGTWCLASRTFIQG